MTRSTEANLGSSDGNVDPNATTDRPASRALSDALPPPPSSIPRSPNRAIPAGGRYRVMRSHARGGLGEVFVARDLELDRDVALKEMQLRHADDVHCRNRFVLEAEITGGLEHPGIVPVYGLGVHADGQPFYAMRFIRGISLREAIDSLFGRVALSECDATATGVRMQPPVASASDSMVAAETVPVVVRPALADSKLAVGRAVAEPRTESPRSPRFDSLEFRKLLRRLVDVCNAIGFAHSRGILHRDIKPGNIMLGEYGETLVVDWGLAKVLTKAEDPIVRQQSTSTSAQDSSATQTGVALGTPAYMSPEQAAGRIAELGPASDIYSLGATLYCLLTGRPPFVGELGDVLYKVAKGDFPRPRSLDSNVPRDLEAICLKAMALTPADRYASAIAMANDLEAQLADLPVIAWREPATVRLRRWVKRHRTAVSTAVAATAVAAVSLAIGLLVAADSNARLRELNQELTVSIAREADARQREESHRKAAEESRRQAQASERLAEERFALANRAVDDFLSEVSSNPRLLRREPGTQKLRRELLTKAKGYYDDFVRQKSTDARLKMKTAAAYFKLANIEAQLRPGSRQELELFEQSRVRYKELAQLPDASAAVAKDYGMLLNNFANSLNSAGKVDDSIRCYREAIECFERAARKTPESLDAQFDVHRCRMNFGMSLSIMNRQREALEQLASALEGFGALAKRKPQDREIEQHYCNAVYGLALARQRSGRGPEAIAPLEQTAPRLRALHRADPGNAEIARLFGSYLQVLAAIYSESNRIAEAAPPIAESLEVLEKLVKDNPDVATFGRELGSSLSTAATVQADLGKSDEAMRSFRRAETLMLETLAKSPGDIPSEILLAGVQTNIAHMLRRMNRPADALAQLDKLIGGLEGRIKRSGGNVNARRNLAVAHWSRAEVLGQLDRYADAVGEWEFAIKALPRQIADQLQVDRAYALVRAGRWKDAIDGCTSAVSGPALRPDQWYAAACVHALAADGAGADPATPAADRARRADALRAKAVELLGRAKQSRFFAAPEQRKNLRVDKDLDGLRGRPDFKKFVDDLEAKTGPSPRS